MKNITFENLVNWKWWNIFDEIYHKQVAITWKLDSSYMIEEDIEDYNEQWWNEYDRWYTYLVDIEEPLKFRPILLGSDLERLLKISWYKNHKWNIRVYGVFLGLWTKKNNIWMIWKADILDDELNVIETIKRFDEEPPEYKVFELD